MGYVGRWKFDSIGMMDENDEMIYMNAEEYLKSPMLYIDETDEEAVNDEMNERKQIIRGQIAVCEDGKLYLLLPFPEGVTQEEIDEAVASGEIGVYDGMLTDKPMNWEERDGELWIEVGQGMSEDGWVQLSENSDMLSYMTIRYVKAE